MGIKMKKINFGQTEFRGISYDVLKGSGKWVYGQLAEYNQNKKIAFINRKKIDDTLLCKVFFETVSQYTGHKDYEEKEKIFAGDIIDATKFKDDPPAPLLIIFENGSFRVQYENWDMTLSQPILDKQYIKLLDYKIMGNIFNNPELWTPSLEVASKLPSFK